MIRRPADPNVFWTVRRALRETGELSVRQNVQWAPHRGVTPTVDQVVSRAADQALGGSVGRAIEERVRREPQ